ncbi:MAG: hypothetical protein IJR25_05325 [Bacteroidales bacterium]|nr:hypothetical protein [Bacteroidales bacterium]
MRFKSIVFAAIAILCAACSNMEYDISEGINKELTLFEDEISVPLGSIGPLTIGSTLNGVSKLEGLGGMVAEYIKQDADGNLILDASGDIFRINIYELEKRLGDVSTAQTWNSGFQMGYIGGMASLLGYINLKAVNQKIVVSASNPLYVNVPASCDASATCMGAGGITSTRIEGLDNFTMPGGSTKELLTIALPEEITDPVAYISLSNLTLDLPANPLSKVSDKNGNLFFAFSYYFSCGIAVGENFSIPVSDLSINSADVAIGKYRLKKCQFTVDLESTIPLSVNISNIRAVKPPKEDGSQEVDENIVITGDVTVPGGSEEKPASTTITLSVEALEGTIPDISGMLVDLNLSAGSDLGDVALCADQGLYVKSSSARITGGITIPQE